MTVTGWNRFWLFLSILLAAVIILSGVFIWSKYHPAGPIEITLSPPPEFSGEVYVGGEVLNPGFYLFRDGTTLADIIRSAGGTSDNTSPDQVVVRVGGADGEAPQKVNINTAERWLLEVLPGIGEIRAGAILDYREENGPFRTAADLMNVEGIGPEIYSGLRDLVTVGE